MISLSTFKRAVYGHLLELDIKWEDTHICSALEHVCLCIRMCIYIVCMLGSVYVYYYTRMYICVHMRVCIFMCVYVHTYTNNCNNCSHCSPVDTIELYSYNHDI